jgi:hypothetical protein
LNIRSKWAGRLSIVGEQAKKAEKSVFTRDIYSTFLSLPSITGNPNSFQSRDGFIMPVVGQLKASSWLLEAMELRWVHTQEAVLSYPQKEYPSP